MTLIFGIAFVFAFTTCDDDNDNTHTHSYSAAWSRNATQHWRECSCGAKTDVADHDAWNINYGEHWRECICGLSEYVQHTGDPCSGCGFSSSGAGLGGGYSIGDTGPGGGKIFYVSVEGFIMTDTGERCHYLEAAPNHVGSRSWASSNYISTQIATETAIGTGRRNTIVILQRDSAAPAAKACDDYIYYGKSDWFLPSEDELNQLLINRNAVRNIGEMDKVTYWSSSGLNGQASALRFDGKIIYSSPRKETVNVVYPVRAF